MYDIDDLNRDPGTSRNHRLSIAPHRRKNLQLPLPTRIKKFQRNNKRENGIQKWRPSLFPWACLSLFWLMLSCARWSTKRRRQKNAVAETEANKVQTRKTRQSTHNAYHKTRSTSAEDWAKVDTIAAQYTPSLKELEAKRDKLLEETNTKRISLSPEAVAKRFERDMAQNRIRDKERGVVGGNLSISF